MLTYIEVDPQIVEEIQAVIQTFILGVLGLLGTGATLGIVFLRAKLVTYIDGKSKQAEAEGRSAESTAHLEAFNCVVGKLDTWSTAAVQQVEQTVVRHLKKEKKWNVDTARGARDTAVDVMTELAGETGLAELETCTGKTSEAILSMFRTWIEMKVADAGSTDTDAPIVPMD